MTERPVFMLALRPEPRVDGIRALRGGLKYLLRSCGLRVVSLQEYPAAHAESVRPSVTNRDDRRRRYAAGQAVNVPRADRRHAGHARARSLQ
jgi:hypothetical protein